MRNFLRQMVFHGHAESFGRIPKPTISGRFKRAFHGLFSNIPLGDMAAWDPMPSEKFLNPPPQKFSNTKSNG